MGNRSISLILMSAFVLALTLGIGLSKDQTVNKKNTTSTCSLLWAKKEESISLAATKVLHCIADARGYIQKNDTTKALQSLVKADGFISMIRESLPTAKIKEHIWVVMKHLDYEDSKTASHDLVSLYASLNDIKGIVPVDEAKKHLKMAKRALRRSEREKAKEELKKASDSLVYREVALPVSETEKHISTAKMLLTQNKPQMANQDLKSAEKDIELIAIGSEKPIIKGKRSLWCATKDYAAGRYGAAQQDLSKAGMYLKEAARSDDEKMRKEAQRLEQEVQQLNAHLLEKTGATSSKLTSLLERIEALAEREIDKLWNDWQRFRSESNVRTDLYEAKLHLAYAESYQMTLADFKRAKEDIKICETYLEWAIKNADQETKVRIGKVKKAVEQIKMYCNDRSEEMKKRYEKVKLDLSELIESLEDREQGSLNARLMGIRRQSNSQ